MPRRSVPSTGFGWGPWTGPRALGMADRIGSVEAGKEADLILVDPAATAPLPGSPDPAEAEELMSRLIFRAAPGHGARRVGPRSAPAGIGAGWFPSAEQSARLRAMDRLLQVLVNAAALYVAVLIVPGLEFTEGGEWWKFLLVAVAFSLLNSFLRPILRILTFPITIVTMGLFLLVINAAMLLLTGAISEQLQLGFTVADFWAALLGSIVISIVGWILSMVVGASRMPARVL